MSVNTAAARLAPSLLRATPRSLARGRRLPHHVSAVAILLPHRNYAPEPHTSSSGGGGGGGNFPPPGFSTKEAQKPLKDKSPEEVRKSEAFNKPRVEHPNSGATAEPKGKPSDMDAQSHSQILAEEVSADSAEKKEALEAKKKEEKKLTLWQKVQKEASHYWDGTKLLATEVKISSKLALKMAAGYELTRREHRQLHRTTRDLGRLVPFSVFVIVPFAELLLPVALKLFPNLLPSTYEGQKTRDAKATNLRATRKEVSSFLRNTLRESGLPLSAANAQKEEFMNFFRKVRTTGEEPTRDDVIKVCRAFKDDITLDNLSRPQLVGICRYMSLNTFGTDAILRYQIRHRMRQIKRDDKAIDFEGVDSLSVPELQWACASRGLRTHGVSPGHLRDDLRTWLDLRLRQGVPSTLLVLSNAFMYAQGKDSEFDGQIDALQAVLSSIPEELFHEIELEVHNAEGAATNRQRLEVIKEQQELINEENEQNSASSSEGRSAQAAPKDDKDIDEKEENETALAQEGEKSVEVKEPVQESQAEMKAEPPKKE